MTFPESCSHLRKWIFPNAESFRRRRQEHFQKSVDNLLSAVSVSQAANLPPCPFSVIMILNSCFILLFINQAEDQELCMVWYVKSLIQILLAKRTHPRVSNTTLAFFTRFFFKESMGQYPVHNVLFACIIIALKAENLTDGTRPSDLFGDAGENFKFDEVREKKRGKMSCSGAKA